MAGLTKTHAGTTEGGAGGQERSPRARPVPEWAAEESVARAVMRFVLSGLAAVLLVGVVGAYVLNRLGVTEAIADARRVTGAVARGAIEPNLSDGIVTRDPHAIAQLDRIVSTRVLVDPVVRVKIWTASGTIVYSDEHRLIGAHYVLDADELQALRAGTAAADLSDLSQPENRFERTADKLLQVYLPVRTPGGTQLLFEAYLRFSSVVANGRQIWLTFGPVLAAALVLLELLQVPPALSLARRLRERQRERELLLRRAIEASDLERKRIAGDLHDGVVQDLAGVAFSLSAAADRALPENAPEVSGVLRDSGRAMRQSVRRLRTLLVEIYPPNLHATGLEAALSDLLASLQAQGVETRLAVPAGLTLPERTEALIFRTAQEGLRNVSKHADASRVWVEIRSTSDGGVSMVVRDDGRGFSPEVAEARRSEGHVGLRLVEDLAAAAGGTLTVSSEPGRGTELRLEVPG